ncbi:inner centromere protein-like [Ceratina calcarata]|uniref:Inner centromere protein-like n=1 Tax=Ceratina calcarata TaxID=156304 RepID=A0AAJ7JGI3_9HYME|nr:inner centromere protein-like [Ceratina calcarata]XP_026666523.1 inner centromere protein-like [Ceratina calcarata]
MSTRSMKKIQEMLTKHILDIYNHRTEVKKSINDNLENTFDYLQALLTQIPESTSGPLIAHTPKVTRKKTRKHIETIPENDVIMTDNTHLNSTDVQTKDGTSEILEETVSGRSRRQASKKAADSIRQQQSLTLASKLRRPTTEDEIDMKKKRASQLKRKKIARSSSEDEQTGGPTKHSKTEASVLSETLENKKRSKNLQTHNSKIEEPTQETKVELSKPSVVTRSSSRKRSYSQSENAKNRDMDETVIAPRGNEMGEQSVYEDAIGKPALNSTMNYNSTYNLQNMVNATVVLERLSAASVVKLNETVTLNKNLIAKNKEEKSSTHHKIEEGKPSAKKSVSHSSTILQDRLHLKQLMANKDFDDLITEDESSPEVKKRKTSLKKRPKRVIMSMTSSEDEVLSTPIKPTLKEKNTVTGFQDLKSTYKSNTLFSPYAKESVKKRIEAFEQVGMSPKTLNIEEPVRLTRTKTRARAAAQAEAMQNANSIEKTVAQKLARKSLAKAKKISLVKQNKNNDEHKENNLLSSQKASKLITAEKLNATKQLKATPLYKGKTHLPMSVARIPHTPVNQVHSNYKALSATRGNIITSVDSFIQHPKSVSKRNSLEKQEEKRRKLNDEDAKKKREETLRLQTEEKRRKRQEKELKNKLAREAKERQDMEKRQKAERDREEKARLAQQILEKQREEMEKKRLAQLQRAQETEERRKQEEQLRMQRLQEQEEAERVLAEQRRREQEAEKRKEERAQQQEAIKSKNQLHQTKYGTKNNGPTAYILDSEPDEDGSDDESRPKHVIPYWALPHVRKAQLAMQRYIPQKAINLFFDTKKCTPDLTQMFQGIDRNRLKRTSSAIWKTPPRYSMMESD